MKQSNTARPPSFFWQGLCILLPVALLAVIGFITLQQDRRQVLHEAETRAQELATQLNIRLAQMIASALVEDLAPTSGFREQMVAGEIRLNARGELLQPPGVLDVPEPKPLEPLSTEQEAVWRTYLIALAMTSELESLEKISQAFTTNGIPSRHQAIAIWHELLAWERVGQRDRAHACITNLLATFSREMTESGVPLLPLAQLKLLEWQVPLPGLDWNESIQSICSNVVSVPTPLTSLVLAQASMVARSEKNSALSSQVAEWIELAQRHAQVRKWHQALLPAWLRESPDLLTPPQHSDTLRADRVILRSKYWEAEEPLLGVLQSVSNGEHAVTFLRTELVLQAVHRMLKDPVLVPAWYSVQISLPGREITTAPQGFNEVEATHISGPVFETKWYLTSPEEVLAQQRQRFRMFGTLIIAAVLVSSFGFWQARRAFWRQQQLSDLKSNFVSSVTHELRAPIASVRLMAEGLERGRISERNKQMEYFRFIVQECRRLSALIENVLDFSRIEQGRKQYERESTDALRLVRDTVKLMQPTAEERQVRLGIDLPPATSVDASAEHWQPMWDGSAIQQALVNLVDNALKHAPLGTTVTVGLEVKDDTTLHLWVQDQGAGIPASEQERIFERFYRRGRELRRETQGVGIGLSIVKHIAEAHGGRVRVSSEPGKGSRFTLELPISPTTLSATIFQNN